MNQHSINRRDFLGTAAGLALTLTILPEPFGGLDEAGAEASLSPNAWLTIAPEWAPLAASANSSCTSRARTSRPLTR